MNNDRLVLTRGVNLMNKIKLPARFSKYAKLPIEQEAMRYEMEYEKLLHNPTRDSYEDQLFAFIFKRCNVLWKKIAKKNRR